MSGAYYNEIEPYAAQWLRNLVASGHIAPGDVDERDIRDVRPDDLRGYTQCHFFAGIGVWSSALRLAGWPDDRPVWTGSCPCQPFSAAGKGIGFDDERHLWPHWHHLIRERSPGIVLGEQVASQDGLGWLDLVHSDMEAARYAFAAVDLCAAGVGAPHIRQRLWFVADAHKQPRRQGSALDGGRHSGSDAQAWTGSSGSSVPDIVGDPDNAGLEGRRLSAERARELFAGKAGVAGHWRDADWIWCRDDKWRPVEPGTFPLAHGATSRVGRLRAYGNAINREAAATFIAAARETIDA